MKLFKSLYIGGNQVTDDNGNIIYSRLPQDLRSSASPQFVNETITGIGYHDSLAFKSNDAFSPSNKLTRFTLSPGESSNGVWYKIIQISHPSVYTINAFIFNIDITESGAYYAHACGKVRFRTNTPITSNTCEWYYDVTGASGFSDAVLNDLIRVVKDVDDGSIVTWSMWVYSPKSWINISVELLEYLASQAPVYYKSVTSGTPGASIAQSNRKRIFRGTGDTEFGGAIKVGGTQVIDASGNLRSHTHAWSDITSGKPTTLAGYGITDAIPSSQKAAASGVASLDASSQLVQNVPWSKLISKPGAITLLESLTSSVDSGFGIIYIEPGEGVVHMVAGVTGTYNIGSATSITVDKGVITSVS